MGKYNFASIAVLMHDMVFFGSGPRKWTAVVDSTIMWHYFADKVDGAERNSLRSSLTVLLRIHIKKLPCGFVFWINLFQAKLSAGQ